jgi:hypothetical protein
MFKILIIVLVLSTLPVSANFGSFGLNSARTAGVGNAGVAMMDRLYTFQLNPASLRNFNDSTFFEFTNIAVLPNFSINGSNNILPIEDLNLYFSGVNGQPYELKEKDKAKLVSNFDGTGKALFTTKINILSAAFQFSDVVGAFGISIDENISARMFLPSDLARLILYGNPRGEEYNFEDFTYQASWTRSISVSYANNFYRDSVGLLRNLNVGTSIKYYQGMGYADLETQRGRVYTNQDAHIEFDFLATGRASVGPDLDKFVNDEGDLTSLPSSAGTGMGFDIGVLGELNNGIRFGFSISDIGVINFTEGVQNKEYSLMTTIKSVDDKEIDSLVDGVNEEFIGSKEFSVAPPSTIRLGVAVPIHKLVAFPGLFNAYLDYTQGINNNFANSLTPRISLGVDWQLYESLPIVMTGISNGITGDLRWSMGLGYEVWKLGFYLSTYDMLSVINPNNNVSVAFNFRWRF